MWAWLTLNSTHHNNRMRWNSKALSCNLQSVCVYTTIRMQLRSRTVKKNAQDKTSMTTNPSPPKPKFRVQWDLILWMIASFATLYLSEFASNLLFNEEVKRWWLALSVLFLVMAVCSIVHAFRKHSNLSPNNWSTVAPILVIVATATGLGGSICLMVAVWPVWGLLTLVIIPVLFMGFISIISLFDL